MIFFTIFLKKIEINFAYEKMTQNPIEMVKT